METEFQMLHLALGKEEKAKKKSSTLFPKDFCENRKSLTALGLSAALKHSGLGWHRVCCGN